MTLQIEPVRAVTSASNFFRRVLCPGSGREEAKYGPDPDTEFSEEGRLLHKYFMTLPLPQKELTQAQFEVLTLANRYGFRFLEDIAEQHGISEEEESLTHREVPLRFKYEEEELMPGHADFIRTWRGRSVRVILDAKFGVLEVDEAASNDQLAIYGVMAQQIDPVETTHVGIIQPRNFGPRMSSASYSAQALDLASSHIALKFFEAQNPEAPLRASAKACHFCRAKVKCPEYGAQFQELYVAEGRAIETVDTPSLIRLHQACAFAAKIGKQVNAEMRKRILAGEITSYKLTNSGEERTVINPAGMYEAFKAEFGAHPGWDVARYDACRTMVWGALEDYVQELTRLPEKKAKERVAEISKPFVTSEPKAKRVTQVK